MRIIGIKARIVSILNSSPNAPHCCCLSIQPQAYWLRAVFDIQFHSFVNDIANIAIGHNDIRVTVHNSQRPSSITVKNSTQPFPKNAWAYKHAVFSHCVKLQRHYYSSSVIKKSPFAISLYRSVSFNRKAPGVIKFRWKNIISFIINESIFTILHNQSCISEMESFLPIQDSLKFIYLIKLRTKTSLPVLSINPHLLSFLTGHKAAS